MGIEGRGDRGWSAVDEDFAGIGAGRPGEDAGEGALTGAVLAHQGMDFAGAQRKGCAFQGVDPIVMFCDCFGS